MARGEASRGAPVPVEHCSSKEGVARVEASRDAPVPVPGESVCDDPQVPSHGLLCA